MIITNQFEINKTENLTSGYIADELQKLGVQPLRWAIVEVCEKTYVLDVSYEK